MSDKPKKLYKNRTTAKTGTKQVQGRIVGRDQKVIPPEEVFKLAQIGCKDNEIAAWFGIDSNTLRYNFSTELETGLESLKQSLRRAQIKLALTGNATMLIWLGKQILNQQEQPHLHTESEQILPWITTEGHKDESN